GFLLKLRREGIHGAGCFGVARRLIFRETYRDPVRNWTPCGSCILPRMGAEASRQDAAPTA
ncbi:MAG: hypothetical protein KC964_31610, partial [Candidatus Omnitrophica bacterium]|nr:hypothetical protein [Candidatus Omnitrophota bacterium]